MAPDSSQNSFRRGVMSLVILALLKKEDRINSEKVCKQTFEMKSKRSP